MDSDLFGFYNEDISPQRFLAMLGLVPYLSPLSRQRVWGDYEFNVGPFEKIKGSLELW